MEGAFTYTSSDKMGDNADEDTVPAFARAPERRKHVFFTSSKTIPVSQSDNPPRSALREAFGARRRPSSSSLNASFSSGGHRSYPFSFDLPRSCRSGEEMPPTFCSLNSGSFEVAYKLVFTWDPSDASEQQSKCVSRIHPVHLRLTWVI